MQQPERRGGGGGGGGGPLLSPPRVLVLLLLLLSAVYFACCSFVLTQAWSAASSPETAAQANAAARALLLRGGAREVAVVGGAGGVGDEEADEAEEKRRIRAALGRGTWNLLHRLAAAYPQQPSAEEEARAVSFFGALGALYPCAECAAHLREMLATKPPDARSNRHLSLWLCELHNDVNVRLAKPAFNCSLPALQQQYGSCGCFDDPETQTPPPVRPATRGEEQGATPLRPWSRDDA